MPDDVSSVGVLLPGMFYPGTPGKVNYPLEHVPCVACLARPGNPSLLLRKSDSTTAPNCIDGVKKHDLTVVHLLFDWLRPACKPADDRN